MGLLFSAYLPVQKNPRCARVWNLPVDVQIIQRAGMRVTDMLVDQPLYSSQKLAFVRMTQHSDLSTVVLNRYSTSCTGTITGAPDVSKAQSRFFAAATHGSLTAAALDVDGVAPVAACGAQELAEMRIGGSKTGNGQKITPISNCAQCNNSAQFL